MRLSSLRTLTLEQILLVQFNEEKRAVIFFTSYFVKLLSDIECISRIQYYSFLRDIKYEAAALAKRKVLRQSGVRPSRRSSVQN